MTPSRLDFAIERWGASGIALTAAALPWERFQFVPTTELTLVRIGATITILAGAVSWAKSRGGNFPRTRMLPCIVLFAVAAIISLPRSHDPAATTAMLRTYFTYAAFFFAMTTFVTTPDAALRLARVYAVSALGVAAITVFAAGGWVWPARWDTAFWAQQRLLQEFRDGQPMRMTGAGVDFNQHSLYLLVGLAVLIFLPAQTRLWRTAKLCAIVLTVAAVACSMSRSGLLIAAGTVAAAILVRTGTKQRIAALAGAAVVVVVIALLASDFTAMFATRAQGGTVYDEGSARNRVTVYRVALALAPRFAITGAGLGASEAAMRQSEFADDSVMAIHSMPLLLLVELGVVGLIAYAWLWWRVYRFGARPLLAHGEPQAHSLGRAFSGMSAVTFVMLLAQPLMLLPLYPFLLGLGIGPAAGRDRAAPEGRSIFSNGLVAAAVVIAAGCVVENRIAFQRTVARTEAYADAMAYGKRAERAGDWETAATRYERGGQLGRNLTRNAYFEDAARLVDLNPLYARFGAASPTDPEAVAWLAAGSISLVQGRLADAEAVFSHAWTLDPQLRPMAFHLAEANWAAGDALSAIEWYGAFRALPSDNGGPVDQIRANIGKDQDDAAAQTVESLLRRAAFARRDGRWDDAVAAARGAASLTPTSAEARYLLGVAAERSGDEPETFYRAALDADPAHRLARVAMERVTGGDR